MYWNYFYNVWKTVSFSPFSNIVAFAPNNGSAAPATIKTEVTAIEDNDENKIYTLVVNDNTPAAKTPTNIRFKQTEALTKSGVAVHPYGVFIIPSTVSTKVDIELEIATPTGNAGYTGTITFATDVVGSVITMTKKSS